VTYHRSLLDHSDQLRTRLGPGLCRGNPVVFIDEILVGPLGPPFLQEMAGVLRASIHVLGRDSQSGRGLVPEEWSEWSKPDFTNETNDPGCFHAWSKPGPCLVQVVRIQLLYLCCRVTRWSLIPW
jgi:hypothetical protein